ncbi:leucine-rich repeat domain-containing protein [Olleya sp. Bg11-27]|uniref:leucine-rich repeat domain-containing protein n=1 Tax=Olleya sp. Bg11-27 TaxID=2058135 RepID=UPI0012FD3513|nr:leucine-rich repeat domain-containing protein [Olleya sp. Bg11-27]
MAYQATDNSILDLSGQSLQTVPKSILKEGNLKVLDLSNNQLTELPDFITELKYLEVITLRNNKFKVAPEQLLKFRYLKTISLSENQITSIPKSFSTLSNLEDFDIGSNPLIEFPQWIDKLYALKDLGIYDLKLETLPDVVTRLSALKVLSLDGNKLTTLPDAIDKLKNLRELWAEANCFEYFPDSFGNLINLEKINFGINKIKYLPESICNLKKLSYLNVSENEIQKLPTNIGQLTRLTNLDISYNKITTLPASFSRLNTKKLEVWFDSNPYSDATKQQIKRLYPHINDSDLAPSKPSYSDAVIDDNDNVKSTDSHSKKIKKEYSTLPVTTVLIICILLLIAFFAIVLNGDDPITKANKKASSDYNAVFTIFKAKYDSILKSNPFIYVYTNDTTALKGTLKPNIDSYVNPYAPYYSNTQSKTEALNTLLNDKRLGYNIVLDNNRVRLLQAKIYDSVFTKQSLKKYSLLVDYKMSATELRIKKKRRSKYSNYREQDRDTVFNSEKIILTSTELADRKRSTSMKQLLAPSIDLDNKDYHFYFSPHDNNITKQEFIEAIDHFKAMFLKADLNKNTGAIKTLRLETQYLQNDF